MALFRGNISFYHRLHLHGGVVLAGGGVAQEAGVFLDVVGIAFVVMVGDGGGAHPRVHVCGGKALQSRDNVVGKFEEAERLLLSRRVGGCAGVPFGDNV